MYMSCCKTRRLLAPLSLTLVFLFFRKRGLESKIRLLLFCMIIFMFTLSTAYWALSVKRLIEVITSVLIHGGRDSDYQPAWLVCNAVMLINVSR